MGELQKPAPSKIDKYSVMAHRLESARTRAALYKKIVDTPFAGKAYAAALDLGIVVLLLVDEATQGIQRIALSSTELAAGTLRVTARPFHEIVIPLNDPNNVIAKAVRTNKSQITDDWWYLFTPALTADEARRNQLGGSIECSMVYPLTKSRGALIFSFFQPMDQIGKPHTDFTKKYARLTDDVLARAF